MIEFPHQFYIVCNIFYISDTNRFFVIVKWNFLCIFFGMNKAFVIKKYIDGCLKEVNEFMVSLKT